MPMWSPTSAKTIVDRMERATPVLATRGRRKGGHVQYAFRYTIHGPIERHISIRSTGTESGVTVYVNRTSVDGIPFPKEKLLGVRVLQVYRKGYQGKNGEKGLSSAAGGLSTLLPKNGNDVY